MSWNIDEKSAAQTVKEAHRQAGFYNSDTKAVKTNTSSLMGALEKSPFVSGAVEAWASNCGMLGLMATHAVTNAALTATSEAIMLHHKGQDEMAANAQKNAEAADYPKELPKADKSPNPVPKEK